MLITFESGAFGKLSGLDEITRVGLHNGIGVFIKRKRPELIHSVSPGGAFCQVR
jgi:hypothetical protein